MATPIAIPVTDIQITLNQILLWPYWDEIGQGATKEYGMSKEVYTEYLPEYQRFMALNAKHQSLGMLSEQVDRIWHSHILNTLRYQEFCADVIGRFVNHLPCSSYELYGIKAGATSQICEEPPATCTDPFPPPPDPSPVPDESDPKPAVDDRASYRIAMRTSILQSTQRFIDAYTEAYGIAPSGQVWNRMPAEVDGIAQ